MEPVWVNGSEIGAETIVAEIQNHPAVSVEDAEREARRALVVRELLRQEADRLGITAEPSVDAEGRRETEEEARIRRLLDDQIKVPEADEAACRRYYDNNQTKFRSPDLYEPMHILLSADAEQKETFQRAIEEAKGLIERLSERPGLFETIARERSDCPSASDGGRLGQVTRGQTTPEFETFLISLEEGQLCPVPVPTPYGVHIIRLERKVEGRTLPFEAVHKRIADYMQEASWRRAAAQYVSILVGRAQIAGVEIEGAESPLVQ
ncbi:MAG: peptidylprolyl isomerase [Rhodospirillaceae bacterium]|nr:peptidylprolyl isomerase [Rhodospirillaceae bacterium]